MKTIILDSATKILYCAIVVNSEVVYEKYITGQNDHAKNIVSVINTGLQELAIDPKSIDSFVCGIGPGSYTGVRMAVTVGKMFALFTNCKLYKISTLELMASGSSNSTLASIDARRGFSYAAIYDLGKTVMPDSYIERSTIKADLYEKEVTEVDFIVDANKVIANAILVENPYLLVPNYIRDTEAERNLVKWLEEWQKRTSMM